MLQRDKNNRWTADTKATLAIMGMTNSRPSESQMLRSDTADLVAAEEAAYHGWLGVTADANTGWTLSRRWFTGLRAFLLHRLCGPAHRAIRSQVEILALGYQKALNDIRSAEHRAAFYPDYLRLEEAQRELRAFLADNFPVEVRAMERERTAVGPLLKQLLLRAKR